MGMAATQARFLSLTARKTNVEYEGRIASISDATGSFYSLIPQDNSAGNFVKVEQRIPVRIEFTENNSEENLQRLRAGMNVECYVQSE